jgi:DNA-binding FrmR family transcriptional regulator
MENPEENKKHTPPHPHAHPHHRHIHSQAEKKAVINRLSKAAGHIDAIKRMIENDADCSEVLIQLAAVRAAINNTGNLVLKNHISHCIVEAVKEGDDQAIKDLNNAIDRFLK